MPTDPSSDLPVPDDQDWTWVLERPCPDCGFDCGSLTRSEMAAVARRIAAEWRAVMTGGHPHLATRPPAPAERGAIWSALEYGAHVRDVFDLANVRLGLMLTEDSPTFANWDQDETALESDYRSQDPGSIAYNLAVHAGTFADQLDKLDADQWDRTGLRSDGASFTVDTFVRYLLHDPAHHLWDVHEGYEALSPS